MSEKIVVKEKIAKSKIKELKKIQTAVASMEEEDIEAFFRESSGESVDKIKELLKEMYVLKNTVSNHMERVTSKIEDYVDSHVELDTEISQIIETGKGSEQKWKK